MDTTYEIQYYKDTMRFRFTDFRVTTLDISNDNWEEVSMCLPSTVSSLEHFLCQLFHNNCLYKGFDVEFSKYEPSKFTVFDPTNTPLFSGQILLPYHNIILFAPLGH